MGTLVICDRCKKPINGVLNDRDSKVYVAKIWFREKDLTGEKGARRYELCIVCSTKVEQFLRETPDLCRQCGRELEEEEGDICTECDNEKGKP